MTFSLQKNPATEIYKDFLRETFGSPALQLCNYGKLALLTTAR